jgi:hypothetical protein
MLCEGNGYVSFGNKVMREFRRTVLLVSFRSLFSCSS